MKVRMPRHLTCIVDMDGRDNYARMPDPELALVICNMRLNCTLGKRIPSPFITSQFEDTVEYGDVWVDGPDEDVALFKLKYF